MNARLTPADRVLGALERAEAPLGVGELMRELGYTKAMVAKTVAPLVAAGQVARFHAAADGKRGPRPFVYMPSRRAPMPATARRALGPDTVVVTPSNAEARVLFVLADGHVELELLQVRPRCDALVTLPWRLLRPLQPGRERPEPVRLELLPA